MCSNVEDVEWWMDHLHLRVVIKSAAHPDSSLAVDQKGKVSEVSESCEVILSTSIQESQSWIEIRKLSDLSILLFHFECPLLCTVCVILFPFQRHALLHLLLLLEVTNKIFHADNPEINGIQKHIVGQKNKYINYEDR